MQILFAIKFCDTTPCVPNGVIIPEGEIMSKEELIPCQIRIKQEVIPYNYGGSNYAARAAKQKEAQEKFQVDFYKTLNAVVDAGGVFCMDKYSLDNEYRMFSSAVRIKIPKNAVEKIKSYPTVEDLTLLNT